MSLPRVLRLSEGSDDAREAITAPVEDAESIDFVREATATKNSTRWTTTFRSRRRSIWIAMKRTLRRAAITCLQEFVPKSTICFSWLYNAEAARETFTIFRRPDHFAACWRRADVSAHRNRRSGAAILQQVGAPDASPTTMLPWKANQFFILVAFILFNLVGIAVTLAIVIWVIDWGLSAAKRTRRKQQNQRLIEDRKPMLISAVHAIELVASSRHKIAVVMKSLPLDRCSQFGATFKRLMGRLRLLCVYVCSRHWR